MYVRQIALSYTLYLLRQNPQLPYTLVTRARPSPSFSPLVSYSLVQSYS